MPHFFACDIVGLLVALSLGIPILVLPGYFFGRSLNLLGFQSQSSNTRWFFAIIFGLAILPIILYVAGRVLSARTSLIIVACLSGAGLINAVADRSWPRLREIKSYVLVASIVWTLVASLSLLDVATANRLYPSTTIVDHSYRSQVIASIAFSDHLPPVSFFFFPGHPVGFHYHYFLFLIGAAMVHFGAGLVSARIALVALTIWVGFALLAITAAYIRLFTSGENTDRAIKISWVLLAVGGLDLIPFGAMLVARMIAQKPDIILFPDLEWWNGFAEVFSWYDSVIWQPHHVAALISFLLGGLILWQSREASGCNRALAIFGAALAFAAGTGSSVLVALVFFVYLVIVTVELFLNAPKRFLTVSLSGILAGLILLPYYLEFRSGSGPSALPLSFSIRPFSPVTLLYSIWHIQSRLLWNLSFLLALPLNYFIELGVFFILGLWWLSDAMQRRNEWRARDHLMIGLVVISMVLATFVYIGGPRSNDFGYRAMLPGQFVLLLWATEIVEGYWSRRGELGVKPKLFARVAYGTAVIGLLTNIANFGVMRSRIPVAERSGAKSEIWPQVLYPAELMYELRAAYLWIHDNSRANAVVQQAPEPYLWLEKKQYSERIAAVQGEEQDGRSGGTAAEFRTTLNRAETLFEGQADVATMQRTCEVMKVDYILAQDSDPVWQRRDSYVWNVKPVFEMPRVRVFRCPQSEALERRPSSLSSGGRG